MNRRHFASYRENAIAWLSNTSRRKNFSEELSFPNVEGLVRFLCLPYLPRGVADE
jgi:hypothetical protein